MDEYKFINPLNKKEKYKIFEYYNYTSIEPSDKIYTKCLIFFAGFNENAAKYIYLLKNYFEKSEIYFKIKIIIPMLNIYSTEDYAPNKYIKAEKIGKIYSWISYVEDENNKGEYVWKTDKKKDEMIINLINKEIKKLNGCTQNIIFVGFSMGGRYLLKILNEMKIKTLFNLLIKTMVLDREEYFNRNNQIFMFFSRFDKIVGWENIGTTFNNLKSCFDNVRLKLDNGKKHSVDYVCMDYLQFLMRNYVMEYSQGKF